MAFLMKADDEPSTEAEMADLDAIAALKESAAFELKEQGNEYVKKGKKHYTDAIDCYTRAINQNILPDSETSVLYANRAHVNLLLANYRRALSDAQEAIKRSPSNVKAIFRAAKAALSLNLLVEAKSYCDSGLKMDPNNLELKKLANQVDTTKEEHDRREAQVSKALQEAKELLSAIEDRGWKIGKAMFRELTGLKKPVLDKNKVFHWPVLLLYAEVMSSDFIEDCCETEMLSAHLDIIFSEPLPWDKDQNYTRESIELYYEANAGVCLSKKKLLHYLLEGTAAASRVESLADEENDVFEGSNGHIPSGSSKWVKVSAKLTLHDVLKQPDFIVPEIPVFYVVSKRSSFYREFKAGKWYPPNI